VINTIDNQAPHADLGMPQPGRVRMVSPRTLPTVGCAVRTVAGPVAGDTWALVPQAVAQTVVPGYRSVSDAFVPADAAMGTSAWSPPS
jgi:hypothetical protein